MTTARKSDLDEGDEIESSVSVYVRLPKIEAWVKGSARIHVRAGESALSARKRALRVATKMVEEGIADVSET